ncbi:ER lumen protein retaining receptor 2 [Plectosphaerella plurivora]|uniref:ER lumen protein retaining receptor 2 n=1 Tax=Plectosphaerella plurivora TaxID=936078 RepID=A0A9P8VCR5_9PEZI|nr:ER lumen protein retaining receptor 2 [Plectosphaerella plurivora]
MTAWNIFRLLGDCSHLASKCILLFAIHRNRSAEGVSLITQGLYTLVFCTRYTDLFKEQMLWNRFFKVFYILSSLYTCGIMQWIYPRSREREVSWKVGVGALGGSLLLSPFAMLILEPKGHWSLFVWIWDFSQILESVCILPQLLLLRQTTVPTVIDSFYLVALGSYRALYLLGWITREFDMADRKPNAVSVVFGIIQTAMYIDFAWVYYTRQRVKLRNGGIVDADDMRRGWLIHRLFGKRTEIQSDDDEESAPALGGNSQSSRGAAGRPKWGTRGISVSADEGVLDTERDNSAHADFEDAIEPDAKMRDPDELALALDEDDDLVGGSSSNRNQVGSPTGGIQNGSEWRDN